MSDAIKTMQLRFRSRRHSIAGFWTIAFLLILAGCSSVSSSTGGPPQSITPLALSPTATSTRPVATPAANSADWTTYHRDNIRSGYLASMADPHRLTKAWNASLDGAVYGEPLVVGSRVIVATEGDTLYALDVRTGNVHWHTNVGTPVPLSQLPCGNIDPLGITGTPVYDPATGLVFAVAEVSGPAHILVGVDASTGKVRVRRSADPSGMNIITQQQRAALALANGMVYIAYGGLDGDCGNYHGWVVASRTDGQGQLLSYQVPTHNEGGIWAASGPAVDAAGKIYVAVGNGDATQGNWDHSDSVLRLSATLHYEDGFAPDQWPSDNAADADLGSMGPLLLPGNLVFADGKTGLGYLLHANALGGVGGQIQVTQVCSSYGGGATVGSVIFLPCTSGVQQVQVGTNARFSLGWHASQQINGSPVVGGHTVYSVDASGTLYALNMTNGTVVASVAISQTSRFATPTLFQNSIFIGTMGGVVAVTAS